MIANIKSLEMYCKDYKSIENYEEALKSPFKYDLHHRREISENKSRKQLIDENLYYNIPATDLIFLEHGEHQRLHMANLSEDTRKKMSEANRGENNPMFGKNLSAETRKKMSEANRGENNPMFGRHWHIENGKRVYTE